VHELRSRNYSAEPWHVELRELSLRKVPANDWNDVLRHVHPAHVGIRRGCCIVHYMRPRALRAPWCVRVLTNSKPTNADPRTTNTNATDT
jgi:hypothetical protein